MKTIEFCLVSLACGYVLGSTARIMIHILAVAKRAESLDRAVAGVKREFRFRLY